MSLFDVHQKREPWQQPEGQEPLVDNALNERVQQAFTCLMAALGRSADQDLARGRLRVRVKAGSRRIAHD